MGFYRFHTVSNYCFVLHRFYIFIFIAHSLPLDDIRFVLS